MTWGTVVREGVSTARSQLVPSLVAVLIVAGMVASVLLTTGRTVGSEQAVLGSIDSAGTRSITVRAESGAGVTATVLDRLAGIEGIAWAGAFGAATDVTNTDGSGGPVALRHVWTTDLTTLGVQSHFPDSRSVWASSAAVTQLGMLEAAGGVVTGDGVDADVVGILSTPEFLGFLEPVLVAPQTGGRDEPVAVLVVIADRPDLVAPLADVVASVLDPTDPSKVSVSTSEQLAALRALVQGQLGDYGRSLILVIFGVGALLVAAVLYGLVTLRRKDFGRRRALGATRGLIIALLLVQMAFLSGLGALGGSAIAVVALLVGGDPLPGVDFFVAIGVLAVIVGVLASVTPAWIASRRDPLVELRVP